MKTVYCPNCGQPMEGGCISEVLEDGTRIYVYFCPNRSGCGTIVREKE